MDPARSTIDPRAIGVASVSVWCVLAGLLLVADASGWFGFSHGLAQAFGAVAIGIALVALLPLSVVRRGAARQQSAAVLGGVMMSMALRSSLTILFAILMWKMDIAPRQAVGLWAIFWYAALLTTEVVVVARFFIAHNRPTLLIGVPVKPEAAESAAR